MLFITTFIGNPSPPLFDLNNIQNLLVLAAHNIRMFCVFFLQVFEDFGIVDRILAVLTDDGANIKCALEGASELSGKLLESLKSERVKSKKGWQSKHCSRLKQYY